MCYEVTVCDDYDLVRRIILDPEMLHRITDDFSDVKNYNPEHHGVWLRCDRGDECVGVVKVSAVSPLDLSIHIHIPKKYRCSCLKIGKAFVEFVEGRKGGHLKLSTRVASKYRNVVKFTKRLGFTEDGIDKMSYKRDGEIYDTVLMSYVFGD